MRNPRMRMRAAAANDKSEKLLWIVAGLVVLMFIAAAVNKVLVNKVADRVILKLQKEYSPSPYGPGIDPDKLDVDQIRQKPKPKPKRDSEWDGFDEN